MERLHQEAILPGPGHVDDLPPPTTPPLMSVASPPPPPPLNQPDSVRAVHRLAFGMDNSQAADPTPVDESDAAAPSCPESPEICCSQLRVQENEEQSEFSRYPTPPAAPPKDQYISESESEAKSSMLPPVITSVYCILLVIISRSVLLWQAGSVGLDVIMSATGQRQVHYPWRFVT
jgi:hypothetical protein